MTKQETTSRSTPSTTTQSTVSRLTSLPLTELLNALQDSVERAAARRAERANTILIYSADHRNATWGLTEAAGQTIEVVEYPEALMGALIRLAERKGDIAGGNSN